MTKQTEIPGWDTLLEHAAQLQTKIPAAILVGGTAATLHAGHVIKDLAWNYDAAILALEFIAGWLTHRRLKGEIVPGTVKKIGAGLRNQRRSSPLETSEVSLPDGRRLELPTIEESLRIKTFLLIDRNATRDYLDVAALSHHIGLARSAAAVEPMNSLYAEIQARVRRHAHRRRRRLDDAAPVIWNMRWLRSAAPSCRMRRQRIDRFSDGGLHAGWLAAESAALRTTSIHDVVRCGEG